MNLEKEINSNLKSKFGTNFRGDSLFRVSWSDSQTEIRKRDYEEFSQNGAIFLRHVHATEECKKYPLIKQRWILEKWVPPSYCYTDEIVSARETGSYECIYIFQDKEGYFLPLNRRVSELICTAILTPGLLGPKTEDSELEQFKEDSLEEQKTKEEVETMYALLAKDSKDNKYLDGFTLSINPSPIESKG